MDQVISCRWSIETLELAGLIKELQKVTKSWPIETWKLAGGA